MKNPSLTRDPYLVWSIEFSGWLGPSRVGYVSNIENAGQFSHATALEICANAKSGRRINEQLRNLPVWYRDITFLLYRQSARLRERQD